MIFLFHAGRAEVIELGTILLPLSLSIKVVIDSWAWKRLLRVPLGGWFDVWSLLLVVCRFSRSSIPWAVILLKVSPVKLGFDSLVFLTRWLLVKAFNWLFILRESAHECVSCWLLSLSSDLLRLARNEDIRVLMEIFLIFWDGLYILIIQQSLSLPRIVCRWLVLPWARLGPFRMAPRYLRSMLLSRNLHHEVSTNRGMAQPLLILGPLLFLVIHAAIGVHPIEIWVFLCLFALFRPGRMARSVLRLLNKVTRSNDSGRLVHLNLKCVALSKIRSFTAILAFLQCSF